MGQGFAFVFLFVFRKGGMHDTSPGPPMSRESVLSEKRHPLKDKLVSRHGPNGLFIFGGGF
jgi:hypothetical protein